MIQTKKDLLSKDSERLQEALDTLTYITRGENWPKLPKGVYFNALAEGFAYDEYKDGWYLYIFTARFPEDTALFMLTHCEGKRDVTLRLEALYDNEDYLQLIEDFEEDPKEFCDTYFSL